MTRGARKAHEMRTASNPNLTMGERPLRIGLLTEHDTEAWRLENAVGARPFALPYGLEHLESRGHEIVQLQSKFERIASYVRKIEHRLGYPVRSSLDLRTAWSCDVVLALLEPQAHAYAHLRRWLPGLPPLLTLECWAAEDLRTAKGPALSRQISRASRLGHIVSLSENQRQILLAAGLPREQLHVANFAVDQDFFQADRSDQRHPDQPAVLCIGQDRGRDFDTFLRAMARLPHHEALLVTKESAISGLDLPGNVTWQPPVSHRAYRNLLAGASAVVVPSHPLAYPTGQSVALESASMGTPVVVSHSPAMNEYISPDEAFMPRPEDSEALAASIEACLTDPDDARRRARSLNKRVARENTAETMWSPVEQLMREVSG